MILLVLFFETVDLVDQLFHLLFIFFVQLGTFIECKSEYLVFDGWVEREVHMAVF
jgi:hypothetical protein